MGFVAYRRSDKPAYGMKLTQKGKWVLDSIYSDCMKGGKKRERDYAKVLEQAGCKIIWDKVKQ